MKAALRHVRCRTLKALGVLAAVAVTGFLIVSWWAIDWTDEGSDRFPGGTILRDDAGNVLRVALGAGDVDCRPFYRASPEDWVVRALVASEDRSFWTHHGVRPLSVLRAAAQNVFYRRRISGASTLTMQAVRLIHPHPKTLWWKWKEAVMALKMERVKSKEWILSQHLNRAPFGSNLVGVEAAAQGWFGKSAKDLGLGEAALLAGILQAPSRFRPDRHYNEAIKRRDYVLDRMLRTGAIDTNQLAAAQSVRPEICRARRPFACPRFCDWVIRRLAADGAGDGAAVDEETTLDADLQALCENAVNAAAAEGRHAVAAVVMHVDSGAVKALACSGDYFDPVNGQVNAALAPRPAGSTLKPFLAALAIDRGLVTPEERLADIPCSFKGYRPANFDSKYRGLVKLQDALVLSLNIPFVRLLNQVGVEAFGDALRTLGFVQPRSPDEELGLGMAIGNVEVSLVELVSAYATLASGGIRRRPIVLKRELVAARDSPPERVFSPGASYLVADMLSGDQRSGAALGHIADVQTSRFAWKTGTSSAYRDAWTVAWNPAYVVGVWCGHMSGGFGDRTLVGARAAAPVAWGIARQLHPRATGPWYARPDGVVLRPVCALTGLPASPDCPGTEIGRAVRGRSANALCPVHRRDADGRRVTCPDPGLAAFTGQCEAAGSLAFASPEDGAVFTVVPGGPPQRIVCRVIGNPQGARLWWFADGSAIGESTGSDPFPVEMSAGQHRLVCVTSNGVSAAVGVVVNRESPPCQ